MDPVDARSEFHYDYIGGGTARGATLAGQSADLATHTVTANAGELSFAACAAFCNNFQECQGIQIGGAGCLLLHHPGLDGSWTWPISISTQFYGQGTRSDWAAISDSTELATFATSSTFCNTDNDSDCPPNGGQPILSIGSRFSTGAPCLVDTPLDNCVHLRSTARVVPPTQILTIADTADITPGVRALYAVNLEAEFADVGPRFATNASVAAAAELCPGISQLANLGSEVNTLQRCRRACIVHSKSDAPVKCGGILFSSDAGCSLLTAPLLGAGVPSCARGAAGTAALQLFRGTAQPAYSMIVSSGNYDPGDGSGPQEVVWESPAFHVDLASGFHAIKIDDLPRETSALRENRLTYGHYWTNYAEDAATVVAVTVDATTYSAANSPSYLARSVSTKVSGDVLLQGLRNGVSLDFSRHGSATTYPMDMFATRPRLFKGSIGSLQLFRQAPQYLLRCTPTSEMPIEYDAAAISLYDSQISLISGCTEQAAFGCDCVLENSVLTHRRFSYSFGAQRPMTFMGIGACSDATSQVPDSYTAPQSFALTRDECLELCRQTFACDGVTYVASSQTCAVHSLQGSPVALLAFPYDYVQITEGTSASWQAYSQGPATELVLPNTGAADDETLCQTSATCCYRRDADVPAAAGVWETGALAYVHPTGATFEVTFHPPALASASDQTYYRALAQGQQPPSPPAAPDPPTSPPPHPPQGTYHLVSDLKSRDDAETHCVSIGGFLARIRTKAQYDQAALMLPSVAADAGSLRRFWVDGSLVDGQWLYSDGTAMTHLWGGAEPSGDGACVELVDSIADGVNDRPCFRNAASLCESVSGFTFESPSLPPPSPSPSPPPSPNRPPMPPDSTDRFAVLPGRMTFDEAADACAEIGGYLAAPQSSDLMAIATRAMREANVKEAW
jgi:hypothetical protein